MNIYANNKTVKHIYAGDTPVRKIYKGDTLVWQINRVTFEDWDSSILKTEDIVNGNSATAPTNPARDGYNFIGWSAAFDNIQQDTVISALYETAYITEVNSVLNASARSNNTLDYQNKSYGYMAYGAYGTGGANDLPVWQTSVDLVFDKESRLGQSMYPVSVTAKGYNGANESVSAGRSGIALKSMTPKTNVLYTKVKMSPYCAVYTDGHMDLVPNQWYYTDVSPNVFSMPPDSSNVYKGKAFYTRGKYFMVTMTVEDSSGTYTLSSTQNTDDIYGSGWIIGSHPTPKTLTFDFTSSIINKKLAFGAKTTKIQFFESTSSSSFKTPAIVNAVCLYNDTINPIS